MKRWLWFFVSILISTGIYCTIRYGLRPKPIPLLNATEFEDPQQIGIVIYKRLRQEVRAERVILLGSSPELPNYEAVWTGFLRAAMADGVRISALFQRENLHPPGVNGDWETISFTESQVLSGGVVDLVKAHMQSGHLVVIHGQSAEVSHLSVDAFSRRLDSAMHHPVLALSTLNVPENSNNPEDILHGHENGNGGGHGENEAEALQAQCLDLVTDNDGRSRLECAQARVAKTLAKKKPAKLWAVAERHGLKEYLIFVKGPRIQQ